MSIIFSFFHFFSGIVVIRLTFEGILHVEYMAELTGNVPFTTPNVSFQLLLSHSVMLPMPL